MFHATCRALRPLAITLLVAAATTYGAAAKHSPADPEKGGSPKSEVKAATKSEVKPAPKTTPPPAESSATSSTSSTSGTTHTASGTAQTTPATTHTASGKIPTGETVKTPPPPLATTPPTTGETHAATAVPETHAATAPVQPQYQPQVEENNWLESHGQIPHFDLGVSSGYNNPAGMLGLEGEYRLYDFLGVGLEGGLGLWGLRFSPVVHGYPFGAANLGLFGELALSLNTGGHGTQTIGTTTTDFDKQWAPTVSVAVGLRRQWLTYFWTTVKLGYQWKLTGANDYAVTGGGAAPQELINAMDFARPGAGMFGGWVLGMSAGIAIL